MSQGALARVLKLGTLLTLVFVVSGCGRGGDKQEGTKARTLPESLAEPPTTPLPAGKYVSDEFKPAVSFRLDEGWNTPYETADMLSLYAPKGFGHSFFEFWVMHKVIKVVSSYEVKAEPPPRNLVAWLENHPYLETEKPQPITVGG